LYYFSELTNSEPKFNSISECKEFYKNISTTSKELNEVCICNDIDDEAIILENTFFELFCYNEYVDDIYQTNKTAHYEEILTENGFILSVRGEHKILSKVKQAELNVPIEELQNKQFEEYMTTGTTFNEQITATIEYLKLQNAETEIIQEYREIITNTFKTQEHTDIISIFKDELSNNVKVEQLETENFTVCIYNSLAHKNLLRANFEKQMKIKPLQVDVKIEDITFFNISDKEFELFKKTFRITRQKPKTKNELFQMYISIIKNITCPEFIISKQIRNDDGKRYMSYKLNSEFIKHHIKLNLYSNKYLTNYDENILKMLNIEKPKRPMNDIKRIIDDDIFLNDSDDEIHQLKANISTKHHLDFGLDDDE
jgi:hypothetical protein